MAKKYSPEALSFPYIQFKHWGKKKLVKKIVDTVSFWSAETSEKPRLASYRSRRTRRTYVFRREREREKAQKRGKDKFSILSAAPGTTTRDVRRLQIRFS